MEVFSSNQTMDSVGDTEYSESPSFLGVEGIQSDRSGDVRVNIENNELTRESAVSIRNLSKSYGNIQVLRNFCMEVQKGTIYGLLGASGCGKTTVLSTIIGLKKWDSGEISVLGESPGKMGRKIGYVPQEVALYSQLSIREMIAFYGCMYNMTNHEVTDRWTFLSKLLDLPKNFRLMGDLSGGQKRRASLAIALVHCPSLLVLDEPTVGLDPLLRRSIWEYLSEIVNTLNTTVIITTHYIEEATLSHTIGFMRQGHLLVQDSPTNLLRDFNCNLMEDVVLRLCRNDNRNYKTMAVGKIDLNLTPVSNSKILRPSCRIDTGGIADKLCHCTESISHARFMTNNFKESSLFQSLQRIRGLTTVIFLTLIRHPLFILPILCLPTIHGTITLVTVGTTPSGMSFGVVNHELLNWTEVCELPKHFTNSNSCDISSLSCKFIHQLKRKKLLELMPIENEKLALDEVQQGRIWGFIVFDRNFSRHSFDVITTKRFANNESLEGSRIRMRMDYSQYIGSFFIVKNLFVVFEEYARRLALSCGIDSHQADVPLNFRPPVYGYDEDNFTQFVAPAALICVLFGVVGVLTSVILIADRKQGTLARAHVAGLNTVDVIISHMITQALISLVQIFLWTTVFHVGFRFTILGPVWLYVLICLMTGLCGAAAGILLGIVSEDEMQALIFGLFWLPVFILFGGTFWPIESMSKFWKRLGYILPTTTPIMSLRSVIIRGLGITHDLVWPGIAVNFTWTVFFWICIVISYKRYFR